MRLLIAPDSFKGSASSEHIIEIVTETAKRVIEDCEVVSVPMADGGEGTLDVLVQALHGRYETCLVSGPTGEQVEAKYGVIGRHTAVVEIAQASGLTLIEEPKRDPCVTSSYGAGELIRHVLERGYFQIYLALGGSATNDGGMGAAAALGVRFLDERGRQLRPGGRNLGRIKDISVEGLIPEFEKAEITIVCDVHNPLLGENGATYVFGPQKGGDREKLDLLEDGMRNYAEVLKRKFGKDVTMIEGVGAAGGLSVPFLIFGKARIASGIETILDMIGFDGLLDGVDLVITGEGRVDSQSAGGKVLSGIGKACREKKIPAVALAGGMGEGAEQVFDCGIESVMTTVNAVMDMDTAMRRTDELIRNAAERLFRLIQIGRTIERTKGREEDERSMEEPVAYRRGEERNLA